MYPEHEHCICNAAKVTMTEEEEIMVNESFQDLFKDKEIPSQYNKEQNLLTKDDGLSATKDTSKLIQWHYHLNHMSFNKLKVLAMLRIIPKI